jgi:hypothetical protein
MFAQTSVCAFFIARSTELLHGMIGEKKRILKEVGNTAEKYEGVNRVKNLNSCRICIVSVEFSFYGNFSMNFK